MSAWVGEVFVAEAETVIELIGDALVWAIIRRYAAAQPGAGSQLAGSANGTAGRDAACTVGQKLFRCPLVEKVLFLETAAKWILDQAGYRDRRAAGEYARNEDPRTIRWAAHFVWNANACWREARRVEDLPKFSDEWTLLVCELSACWLDRSFRAWVESRA